MKHGSDNIMGARKGETCSCVRLQLYYRECRLEGPNLPEMPHRKEKMNEWNMNIFRK
jgi:hypothetical protein